MVRTRLAHGVAQALAERHGVDLLHVKGPAVDPSVRDAKPSSDADILVRPSHLGRLVGALRATGWQERSGFDEGSAFAHAANWHHPGVGYLDVHRRWPGPTRAPEEVFDIWWSTGHTTVIANRECQVPSLDVQELILLLHAARDRGHRGHEVTRLWHHATPAHRDELRDLARELGAGVALAAAVGELDRHRDAPDYQLWHAFSSDSADRLDDWAGRWQAAGSARERLAVLGRALVVNRAHLEFRYGRPPRRGEVAVEWFRRWGRLLAELGRRIRGSSRDGGGAT